MNFHEHLAREEALSGSSNRVFGLVIGAALVVVALWPLTRGQAARTWLLLPAGIVGLLALWRPATLSSANRLWSRFGLLLHHIVSPLVLGLIFFGVITPAGWLRRRFGAPAIATQFDPEAGSYWIARRPPGPPPETMVHQF